MDGLSIRSVNHAFAALVLAVLSSACSDAQPSRAEAVTISTDPLVARALNDPLMVDPDLAYRNEANAAITIRADHLLPLFEASEDLAMSAREAGLRDLLDDGPIAELPIALGENANPALAEIDNAGTILRAVGGPERCAGRLSNGLRWTGAMPEAAMIMPHGMVHQAAGADAAGCIVRVVRYRTPAKAEDVLQYHFTRADRARLRVDLFREPEASIAGIGREAQIAVHTRPGPHGMTEVDLIYWVR